MKNYIKLIMMRFFSLVLLLFRIFPLKNNRIYVINFKNGGFSDNPKYIVSELNENFKTYKFDIYWKTKKRIDKYENIHCVKAHSLNDFYYLSTSKFIISNVRIPLYYLKRKKQIYIETWHGGIAFKKCGFDGNNRNCLSNAKVLHAARYADVFVSNSNFCTNMYRKAFRFKGKILEVGSPRVDALFSNNRKLIKDRLGIDSSIKIITYAPTFRDNGNIDCYNIDFCKIIKCIENRFSGKFLLLIRLHPIMVNTIKFSEGRIITDDTIDLYETLSVTDVLISDYSSLIFEFMALNRPIFIYASDLKEYEKERGLYFKLSELPFSVSTNNDELCTSIQSFSQEIYTFKVNEFKRRVGFKEKGNASKKVVEYILENFK